MRSPIYHTATSATFPPAVHSPISPGSQYHSATSLPLIADGNELAATMDKLNLKFGHTTVHFAGMLPARDSAPTRIAFTQIPVQYGVEYM